MKHILCAVSLCLSSSLGWALPDGETLGTYFDLGATQTSISVAPSDIFEVYFFADNIPVGVSGYEFYVNMPPELLILSATAHPADSSLDIDSSPEGFIVGVGGPCMNGPGPILLAEFTCMAWGTGTGLEITLAPATPSSFGGLAPGYCECGTLALFPFADAYPGPATVNILNAGAYCFCDGSGSTSPCGNPGATGKGCANSYSASGTSLHAEGSVSVAAHDLVLHGNGVPPNEAGLFFQANNPINGGAGRIFGDGLRCAGGSLIRLQVIIFNDVGVGATTRDLATKGAVAPGDVRRYQLWYRDPVNSPCATGFNTSNGLEITWES